MERRASILNGIKALEKFGKHAQDDGFKELTGDQYMDWRVISQLGWYKDKSTQDYENRRYWRVLMLFAAALGTIVAISGLAPWVAVTTAVGTTIAMFMELNMIGRNQVIYDPVATQLEIELAYWQIYPEEARKTQKLAVDMVEHIENIFQTEREAWMQQAVETQQGVEQMLAKNMEQQSLSNNFMERLKEYDPKTLQVGVAVEEDKTTAKAVLENQQGELSTAKVTAAPDASVGDVLEKVITKATLSLPTDNGSVSPPGDGEADGTQGHKEHFPETQARSAKE